MPVGNNELRVYRTGPWAVPLTNQEKASDRLRRLQSENTRLQQEVAELRLRNILLEESLSKRR
jgi:hypothetical protein